MAKFGSTSTASDLDFSMSKWRSVRGRWGQRRERGGGEAERERKGKRG